MEEDSSAKTQSSAEEDFEAELDRRLRFAASLCVRNSNWYEYVMSLGI